MKMKKVLSLAVTAVLAFSCINVNAAPPTGATRIDGTNFSDGTLWGFPAKAKEARNIEREIPVTVVDKDGIKALKVAPDLSNSGGPRFVEKIFEKPISDSKIYFAFDVNISAVDGNGSVEFSLRDDYVQTITDDAALRPLGASINTGKVIFRIFKVVEDNAFYYGAGSYYNIMETDKKITAEGFNSNDTWYTVEIQLDFDASKASLTLTNKATGAVFTDSNIALTGDFSKNVKSLSYVQNRYGGQVSSTTHLTNIEIYTGGTAAASTTATATPAGSTTTTATPAAAGTDAPPSTSTGDKTNPVTADNMNGYFALVLGGLLVTALVIRKKSVVRG